MAYAVRAVVAGEGWESRATFPTAAEAEGWVEWVRRRTTVVKGWHVVYVAGPPSVKWRGEMVVPMWQRVRATGAGGGEGGE